MMYPEGDHVGSTIMDRKTNKSVTEQCNIQDVDEGKENNGART